MADRDSAARAERQAFDVLVLRKVGARAIDRAGGADRRIAHRQPADIPRSRHVAFEQRRRSFQDVRNVVETVAFVVGRQQGRGIDIERKQIANRVGVFGSIQAMERGVPGIGMRSRPRCRWRFRAKQPRRSSVALSGRGMPCGGIASTRTFWITFSQISAFSGTLARSALWSDRPPVFSLSL